MSDERRQSLEAAFFNLPAPAAIIDADFRFQSVNLAFCRLFEYEANEVAGKKAEFFYDDILLEVARNAQRVIGGDSKPELQVQRTIRTRSGKVLDSLVCVSALSDVTPRRYVALYQHVTDAHDKERVLLSRAEMFRLMVENSPLPISVQDDQWRLVLVNKAYCDFTGYQKSELIGRDPATLLHPPELISDLPAQRKAIQNLNMDDFPRHQVIREFVRRDGSRGRYSGSLGFTRGPAGESLWCATLIDLSALDKLRGQLNEQSGLADRLQVRFDRFNALTDDGMAIVERSRNRIVHANGALARLFAVDAALLADAPLNLLWRNVHADDVGKVSDALTAATTEAHSEVTIRMRRDDGDERKVRLRLLSGEQQQPEYFLVFEDITEAIERQQLRERQAVAHLEAIVGEVHHRIKNHLQGVLALLPQREDVDPKTNALLAKAAAQISSIAEVHGVLMKSLHTADLGGMVDAIARAAVRLWDVPVEVKVTADGSAPTYAVSEKESVPLALILNELLLNAIKHRKGSGPVAVLIRPQAHDVHVIVSNAGTLPPSFDFMALPSTSGLGLVRSLFARSGTRLTFSAAGGRVSADLVLSAPVVESGLSDQSVRAP